MLHRAVLHGDTATQDGRGWAGDGTVDMMYQDPQCLGPGFYVFCATCPRYQMLHGPKDGSMLLFYQTG